MCKVCEFVCYSEHAHMIQLFKLLACAGRNLFQFNLDSWTSGCIRKQFERTYSWHWLVLLRTLVKIMCNFIFPCCSERRNQSVAHCNGHVGQVDPKVFVGIMIYIQPSCKMSLSVNRRWSSASLAMRRDALQPDTAGVVVLFATWIWWSHKACIGVQYRSKLPSVLSV